MKQEKVADFCREHLNKFQECGGVQATAICPFHEDNRASFSVNLKTGLWMCHGCNEKGDFSKLKKEFGNNSSEKLILPSLPEKQDKKIVAIYDYELLDGTLAYQVVRYKPKTFRQRRPDGKGGWIWNLDDVEPMLYRLRFLYEAYWNNTERTVTVFVVEGEKDVNNLCALGLPAVCNSGGAGKWSPKFADPLSGVDVVIIADKDEPGRKHAKGVASTLLRRARTVKILELPGEGKDVSDWLEAGGEKEELIRIVANTEAVPLPKTLEEKVESVVVLMSEPQQQTRWLIEDIWPDGARGFIAGNPGVGKTWLALAFCFSCVSGRDLFGKFPVRNPGPCLLIEEESSRHNLQRRLHALSAGMGYSLEMLKDFHHLTRSFVKVVEQDKEIITVVKKLGCKLIVFDSFRRFHGKDENSSSEMQEVLDSFAKIQAETGAAILIIHHLRKDGQQGSRVQAFEKMRGTGDLWAWRDCVIAMEGKANEETAQCIFQFRDAEPRAPLQLRRESVDGSVRFIAEELAEHKPRFIESIASAMKGKAPLSKNEIYERVGGNKQKTLESIAQLIEEKKIIPIGEKWKWKE
jgi:putative DNA primase/helicase